MKNIIITQNDTPMITMPKVSPGDETLIIKEGSNLMSKLSVMNDGTLSFEQGIEAATLETKMFMDLLRNASKFKAVNSKKTAFDVKTTDKDLLDTFGNGGTLTFSGACSFTIRDAAADTANSQTAETVQEKPAAPKPRTKHAQASGIVQTEKQAAPVQQETVSGLTAEKDMQTEQAVSEPSEITVQLDPVPEQPVQTASVSRDNPFFSNMTQNAPVQVSDPATLPGPDQVPKAKPAKATKQPKTDAPKADTAESAPLTKTQKEAAVASIVGTPDKSIVDEVIKCINMSSDSDGQLKFQLKYHLATLGYSVADCEQLAEKLQPVYRQIKV